MNEMPSYYAIIPATVRYSQQLKANEKLLYGEITSLANKTGECWASNQYFADLYNVTPQAVSRWINNLSRYGYINIDYIYKQGTKEIEKRIIRINSKVSTNNSEVSINGSEVSINDLGGYKQKVKDNNTSNNNKHNNKHNNSVSEDVTEIIDYLNMRLGTRYQSTTKVTKDVIKSRLNEHFTVQDFKDVIDKKCIEWANDEKMAKYLRPQTLFGNKFEAYLNEPVVKQSTGNKFLDALQKGEFRE